MLRIKAKRFGLTGLLVGVLLTSCGAPTSSTSVDSASSATSTSSSASSSVSSSSSSSSSAEATVTSLKVKNVTDTFGVGDSISLDDYVKVETSDGSAVDYVATVITTGTAELDDTGKVLTITAVGSVRVSITAGSKSAFLSFTAVSKLTKEVTSYLSSITDNYTATVDSNANMVGKPIDAVHTANYVYAPYDLLLGTGSEDEYSGYMKFSDGNAYQFGASASASDGNIDPSTIKIGQKIDWDGGYYALQDFESDAVDLFSSHSDSNGNEDYLVADNSENLQIAFYIDVFNGIYVGSYDDGEIRLTPVYGDDGTTVEGVYVYYYYTTEPSDSWGYTIKNAGTSEVTALDTFVADTSNEPIIDSSVLSTGLDAVVKDDNMTVTSTSIILDSTDSEVDVASWAGTSAAYAAVYYNTATTKYIDGAFLQTVDGYSYDSSTSTTSAAEYVYGGFVDTDEKTYEVVQGEDGTYTKGDVTTNYWSPSALFSRIDYDSFDYLAQDGNSFDISVGKTSQAGEYNLYLVTLLGSLPEANYLFSDFEDSDSISQDGANGSYGQGNLTVSADDSGFTFYYYVRTRFTDGGDIYHLYTQYTVSDVGTTTIPEFASFLPASTGDDGE